MTDTPPNPLVTVVVPTRNNHRTIDACLAAVRAQTYPAVELVVVDNHSSDDTAQIATRYADQLIVAGPERSAQRNVGIEQSNGEWVLWLDSDMVLPDTTVELAVRTAQRTAATAVNLPERTIGEGFWTACRTLERTCYLNQPWLHNPRLVRRDYLVGAGGFHPQMAGPEDADLRMRMLADGVRMEFAPVMVDHDEGRLTLRSVFQKRYYYGLSIPAFAGQHQGAVGAQGRAIMRAYVANRRILAADPVHAAGMVLMRGMEMVGYGLGALRGRRDRAAAKAHQ